MSGATYDLCTIADVKSYLGLAVSTDDVILQTLVTSASRYIQTTCGGFLLAQSYSETRNGLGNTRLTPRYRPLVSVQSLTIDGIPIPAQTTPTGSGYAFDVYCIYLSGYTYTRAFQNVAISYNSGYAVIPEDIKEVAIELAAGKYKRRSRIGVSSTGMGRETVTFTKEDISPDGQAMIAQYSLVIMG